MIQVDSGTTKTFGIPMAKSATISIVEAEEIVETGTLDPGSIDLPGIYIDRIVQATTEKTIEILKLREDEGAPSDAERSASVIIRF